MPSSGYSLSPPKVYSIRQKPRYTSIASYIIAVSEGSLMKVFLARFRSMSVYLRTFKCEIIAVDECNILDTFSMQNNSLLIQLSNTINKPLMPPRLHRPPTRRSPHTTCNATPLKQMTNILQVQLIRLRKETINNRHPTPTKFRKNNKCPPRDIINQNRCDLLNCKHAHPIHKRPNRLSFRPNARSCHFRRIELLG